MFQIDDKFLQEIGLGELPREQKEAFKKYFREQLELRVGTELSEGLSDAQLQEFEHFVDRNHKKVQEWIQVHAPNYTEDQVYQQLKSSAEQAPQEVPEEIILAEYASLKWLGLNRPDYRQVVVKTMDQLKQETIKNRDAILGKSSQDDQNQLDESAAA